MEDEYHRPANLESKGYFSDLRDAVIRFAPIDINNQQFYREVLKNL